MHLGQYWNLLRAQVHMSMENGFLDWCIPSGGVMISYTALYEWSNNAWIPCSLKAVAIL